MAGAAQGMFSPLTQALMARSQMGDVRGPGDGVIHSSMGPGPSLPPMPGVPQVPFTPTQPYVPLTPMPPGAGAGGNGGAPIDPGIIRHTMPVPGPGDTPLTGEPSKAGNGGDMGGMSPEEWAQYQADMAQYGSEGPGGISGHAQDPGYGQLEQAGTPDLIPMPGGAGAGMSPGAQAVHAAMPGAAAGTAQAGLPLNAGGGAAMGAASSVPWLPGEGGMSENISSLRRMGLDEPTATRRALSGRKKVPGVASA